MLECKEKIVQLNKMQWALCHSEEQMQRYISTHALRGFFIGSFFLRLAPKVALNIDCHFPLQVSAVVFPSCLDPLMLKYLLCRVTLLRIPHKESADQVFCSYSVQKTKVGINASFSWAASQSEGTQKQITMDRQFLATSQCTSVGFTTQSIKKNCDCTRQRGRLLDKTIEDVSGAQPVSS